MKRLLASLMVSGTAAFACSYSQVLWEPSSDADPPYYRIWSGKNPGWIDRTGKRVPEPAEVIDSNRLNVLGVRGLFGYTRAGETVIPLRYLEAREFSEGRARVITEGPCIPVNAGFCGAPIILPPSAIPASVPRLDVMVGKWRPTAPACRYAFIDERGESAGLATFEDTGDFHDGLAAVRVGKLWGYVDRSLTMVIPPQFQSADAFSEGLATVRGEAGVSYIDRTGRVVIPGPFEQAGDFHEGVAAVYRDRRAHYIDRTGRRAVPGTYMYAGRFFHGIANVNYGKSAAYIDRNGRVIYRWNLKP